MRNKKNKNGILDLFKIIRTYIAGKKRSRLASALFVVMVIVLLVSVSDFFKSLMFIVFLLGINLFVSYITIPLARMWIGIELILFSTILVSIVYGPKAGMVMGLLSALVNYIGTVRFSVHCVAESVFYMIIGLTAYFFGGFDIVVIGVIAAVLYNLALNIVVIVLLPGNYIALIIWSATNILFNVILFRLGAPLMLRLMG